MMMSHDGYVTPFPINTTLSLNASLDYSYISYSHNNKHFPFPYPPQQTENARLALNLVKNVPRT